MQLKYEHRNQLVMQTQLKKIETLTQNLTVSSRIVDQTERGRERETRGADREG